jgi:hypothetical protein
MNDLDQIALTNSKPHLALIPGVVDVGDWSQIAQKQIWALPLKIKLDVLPSDFVSEVTEWILTIDFSSDLWGEVKIYPSLGEQAVSTTFQHQQFNGSKHSSLPCRSGNICTNSWLQGMSSLHTAGGHVPVDTIGRIVWHTQRAIEWINQAAEGNLSKVGSHFELPDFKTSEQLSPYRLGYYENNSSLNWADEHQSGIVELAGPCNGQLFTKVFYDRKAREVLYEPAWGNHIKSLSSVKAYWIKLKSVPVLSAWQAPSTFKELADICSEQNVAIADLMKNLLSYGKCNVLLLGMPIPDYVGQNPSRMHWQALELLPLSVKPVEANALLNRLKAKTEIKWFFASDNWSPNDLLSRGRLSGSLTHKRVLLIGAGALGSTLANQLVRMGVNEMTIIDFDLLEGGNLVRHQLTLSNVNQNKAKALAAKLNESNPSAQILAIEKSISSDDIEIREAINKATLIIDTTAEDLTLRTMIDLTAGKDIPVISCSLALNADKLFLYAASGNQFNWTDFEVWFHPYRIDQKQLEVEIDLPRGAGCWHPLTPARLNRIESLSGIAVEYIEQICENPHQLPVRIIHDWPTLKIN